jgi:hypothetical protein
MKRWLPAILLLVIAIAAGVYFLRRPAEKKTSGASPSLPSTALPSQSFTPPKTHATNDNAQTGSITESGSSPARQFADSESQSPGLSPVALPEPTSPEQELPQLPPTTVLENVRAAFRQYQSKFGANPVGTNPEITRALNGENRRQIRFLRKEDGMRVNARGELIDTWGTPYFFHQLSGTEMEIHSAGHDKILWTSDDLVIK